jgi:hypothetical protein
MSLLPSVRLKPSGMRVARSELDRGTGMFMERRVLSLIVPWGHIKPEGQAARALGFVASPLRSITANIFIFLASTAAASRVTVSATELLCAPLRLACCVRMWKKYVGNRLNASSI